MAYGVSPEDMSGDVSDRLASLAKNQAGKCWWCGARADSHEHKYKRTDLRRLANGDDLIWANDSVLRPIRSHRKSKDVLFGLILCKRCNDTRSQPFDRAYDKYAAYVSQNISRLWRAPGIRLEHVYGDGWEQEAKNLARYFAKHFGCLIAENGFPPPETLLRFLSGQDETKDFSLCLIKDQERWLIYKALRGKVKGEPGLWITPGLGWVNDHRLTGYKAATLIGHVGIQFEWHEDWGPQDSFYVHPHPVLNVVKAARTTRRAIRRLGTDHRQ
ncbi:hypothetical protein StoSoilB22_07580 [Arthrobacter sp. StoSoilB22]|nr:hypothetical protein StoSoilB22_07580 [Arthrobacter sp. StoSoilB22]